MKTYRKYPFPAFLPYGVGLLIAGCGGGENSLLEKHMADDPNVQAQQRWNTVRGNVKLRVAEQHFKAQRFDEAEAVLHEISQLSPDSIGVYKLAVRLYLEQGRLMKAREAIDHALVLSGRDAETEYLAGIVAQRYGELDAALTHYLSASSLASDVPEYVLAVAETYVALDEPAAGLDFLEPRIDDFDGFIPLRMLAANICQSLNLKTAAVEHCLAAIGRDDRNDTTDIEAAMIFQWADQFAESIALLRPIVDRSWPENGDLSLEQENRHGPGNRGAAVTLARAYLGTRQWPAAMGVLKLLMADDKSDINAWCLYCRAALSAGDLDSAWEAIDVFNRHNPPTPETCLLQAYVAHRRGDREATRRAATEALKLDEDLESARWLLGQVAGVSSPSEPVVPERNTQSSISPPDSLQRHPVLIGTDQDAGDQGPGAGGTLATSRTSERSIRPTVTPKAESRKPKESISVAPFAIPELTGLIVMRQEPPSGVTLLHAMMRDMTDPPSRPPHLYTPAVSERFNKALSESGMPTFSTLGYGAAARNLHSPDTIDRTVAAVPRTLSRHDAHHATFCSVCREHPCGLNWKTRTALGSHHTTPFVETAKLETEAGDE